MAKMVTYNGNKETYYGCSDPSILEKGKFYEVISENDERGFQTNYILRGVEGYFNSVWFDEVPTYLATANQVPIKGEKMRNFVRVKDEHIEQMNYSSTVRSVKNIINDIYEVFTKNTIYIVKVIK